MADSQVQCSDEEHYYKLDNILLSSCKYLRKHFHVRWKSVSCEDWVNDHEYKLKFLNGAGNFAFKKAPAFQKSALKNQSVEEWDIALLSLVIQSLGNENEYLQQNQAVRQLKTLRNELAHHTSKKISKPDYAAKLKNFRESMIILNVSKEEIDTLIEAAGSTSSVKAKERLDEMFIKAKHFLDNKCFEEATEIYTEAIAIPSLLPKDLAEAYEQRANCFLRKVKDSVTDQHFVNTALLDSIKALELNEYSWRANYLTAQCYRWKNNLPKATHYHQKALLISPNQFEVKQALDCCKDLLAMQQRHGHLDPVHAMNFEERVAHYNDETGHNLNQTEFIKARTFNAMFTKGQLDVFLGHRHYCGWGFPQNFTEAAKYYQKAAEAKNPEGMYNLALCFQKGVGVKQDIQKALKMYKEIAEMNIESPGEKTQFHCNIGVASAQHSLGLMYENGVGVVQNKREAAAWYKRAMENGLGRSANNLAILYSKGDGVKHDDKMAEMCWRQAVNLKDVNAPKSLLDHYINQIEPEKALEMLKIGRQLGNSELLKLSDDEISGILELVKTNRKIDEPYVREFEQTHKLETKGFTFRERLMRANKYLDPSSNAYYTAVYNKHNSIFSKNFGGKAQTLNCITVLSIQERAKNGSTTAAKVLETFQHSVCLTDLLKSTNIYSEKEKQVIIGILYECAIRDFHLVRMTRDLDKKLRRIVENMFEANQTRESKDEAKIRFCYVRLNLIGTLKSKDPYAVEILKEGIRRYPTNLHYYDLLVGFFGYRDQFAEGVHFAKKGLETFPNNADLLYSLAVHQRMHHSMTVEAISTYKLFLSVAPTDHRKYPEAHYQISLAYLRLSKEKVETNEDYVELARQYFQTGQEVEKFQLECYLPYAESDVKILVGAKLNIPTENQKLSKTSIPEDVETHLSILKQKPYLMAPARKAMMLQFRETLKKCDFYNTRKGIGSTATPRLVQERAHKMASMTPITLQEMNPTQDHIFINRFIELTIIEDPSQYFPSIQSIAEDINGDTTRLYIYNVEKTEKNLDNFRVGCRLAILNPYMRISAYVFSHGIRNDEPGCLIYLDKMENVCRFCTRDNAVHKCSKCKRSYCSRECQKLDWKEFNHKLICSVKY